MLRPEIKIKIQFADNSTYPTRGGSVEFGYVTELEVVSSWRNLGDTCKFKMPRGSGNGVSTVYAYTPDGKTYDYVKGIASMPANVDSPDAWPLVMRGDRVTVTAGYRYFTDDNTEKLESNIIFDGWITKIINKIPIEIECMDDMYKFQQFAVPPKTYKITDTVEYIVKDILHAYNNQLSGIDRKIYFKPAPSNTVTTTNAVFRTENETFAKVLERLRKEVGFESWLRLCTGTVDPATGGAQPGEQMALHSSPIIYWPDSSESSDVYLEFQNNIISDKLEYNRIDDVNMGAVAFSYDSKEVGGKTNKSNGKTQTKKERYEVFVGFQNGKFISKVLQNGTAPKDAAKNFEGETKTFYFWNKKSTDELIQAATSQLRKFAYEGWRGSFETFGLPRVKHGDKLSLKDNVLPERTGKYFVRAVTTTFGIGGFRQMVDLDIRIGDGGVTDSEISKGI